MEKHGRTRTDLATVLDRAWSRPFATKSNFAREAASLIGMAASDGLITTKQATGLYGHEWRITEKGLKSLWRLNRTDEEDFD